MTMLEIFQMLLFWMEYFKQFENYIDILGLVYIYSYVFTHSSDEYEEIRSKQYQSIGIFLILTNLILQLANLSKTLRTIWIIIENSFMQVLKYMFIPALFLLNFTFAKTIIYMDGHPFEHRFKMLLGGEYQQIFGENVENLPNQKLTMIFLYVFGTYLINIVCLNILISVVTDNYDLVIQRVEAEDYKFKAKKLLT